MDPRVLVVGLRIARCQLVGGASLLLEQKLRTGHSKDLLWPYLGMRSQKMVEHMEKGQDMLLVVARLAGANVIDDHVTNFFPAMFLVS